jgi:hypothetical protein
MVTAPLPTRADNRHDRRQTPPEGEAGRHPRSVSRPRRGPRADEAEDKQRLPHRIRPPPSQTATTPSRHRARKPKAPHPRRRRLPSHPVRHGGFARRRLREAPRDHVQGRATASPASRVSTSIRSDQRDHGRHQDRAEVHAHHAAQRPVSRHLSARATVHPNLSGMAVRSRHRWRQPTPEQHDPSDATPRPSPTARSEANPDRYSQPPARHPDTTVDRLLPRVTRADVPDRCPAPEGARMPTRPKMNTGPPHRIRPPPPQATADLPRQRARKPKAPTPHRRSLPPAT